MRISNSPALMSFDEKYGPRQFLVNSQEEANRVAALIVIERDNEGYYYDTDIPKLQKRHTREIKELKDRLEVSDYAGLSEEEIESLPEKLKVKARESIEKFGLREKALKLEHAEELLFAEQIAQLRSSSSPSEETYEYRGRERNLATWILDSRSDYQYEGYSIETLNGAPSEEELLQKAKSK